VEQGFAPLYQKLLDGLAQLNLEFCQVGRTMSPNEPVYLDITSDGMLPALSSDGRLHVNFDEPLASASCRLEYLLPHAPWTAAEDLLTITDGNTIELWLPESDLNYANWIRRTLVLQARGHSSSGVMRLQPGA
jgi:hypothetical protein